MHPVAAWMIGAAYISYRYGWQCKMLPLPHRYLALTAFISIASIVSMANEQVGAVFAYGSLLAMFLYGYRPGGEAGQQVKCDSIKPTTTRESQSGSQSGSQQRPTPQPGPAPSGYYQA